jgi:PAS domain S-box-containing protein
MIEKNELLVINQIENYAILTIDGCGQIASWNKGARRLIGYEEEEVIGLPVSIIFTPEDVRQFEPEREMHDGITKGLVETKRWHIGKYGMRFWAESSLSPLRNESEEITGFIKILRAENYTNKPGEEKSTTARIGEAVSNYLTDDFLATQLDEFKDPLNTIRDFAELIMRTDLKSQTGQIHWAAEIIHRHAEAQARIIRDLLDNLNRNKMSTGAAELSEHSLTGLSERQKSK